MATRKTSRRKRAVGRRGQARTRKVARAKAAKFRTAIRRVLSGRSRKVIKIRYVRTHAGRVRFIPLEGEIGSKASYASRQGARRAARRLYKGYRVVAVVAV